MNILGATELRFLPSLQKEYMKKEEELMLYLHKHVFDPILGSDKASRQLQDGVRLTIMRMNKLDADGMLRYYWSSVIGTDRSTKFARQMKAEGFTRFEEVLEDFREKFNDKWVNS